MPEAARRDPTKRALRTTAVAWIALLALMLASLGSAYLDLGAWNLVAGLAIAAIKSAIVVWLFMRMRECGPLIRLAAVAGLGVLAILVGLSGLDYATRAQTPAAVQRPQQLLPALPALIGVNPAHHDEAQCERPMDIGLCRSSLRPKGLSTSSSASRSCW